MLDPYLRDNHGMICRCCMNCDKVMREWIVNGLPVIGDFFCEIDRHKLENMQDDNDCEHFNLFTLGKEKDEKNRKQIRPKDGC